MPSPLGHMLSGALIAGFPTKRLKKPSFKRIIACALLAAAADLDMLLVFVGLNYFDVHRTFSHSLVVVFFITLIFIICNQYLKLKNTRATIPVGLIAACLTSHIFLDLLGQDYYGPSGLMILWPFSTNFFNPDLNLFSGFRDGLGNVLSFTGLTFAIVKEITIIGLSGLSILAISHFYIRRKSKTEYIEN